MNYNNQPFLHALTEIIRRIRGYEITNPFTFYFKQILSKCLLSFSHLVVCIFKTFILILIFNPSHTERVLYLDLVTSMFVVCFRWPLVCQGKEQEAGGGDGGRFPGHPEHVNIKHLEGPVLAFLVQCCFPSNFPKHFVLKIFGFSPSVRHSKLLITQLNAEKRTIVAGLV